VASEIIYRASGFARRERTRHAKSEYPTVLQGRSPHRSEKRKKKSIHTLEGLEQYLANERWGLLTVLDYPRGDEAVPQLLHGRATRFSDGPCGVEASGYDTLSAAITERRCIANRPYGAGIKRVCQARRK